MNWDAAGAIGEVIGTSAVVIFVIHLSSQIRKQAEEPRLYMINELLRDYFGKQIVIVGKHGYNSSFKAPEENN